MDPIKQGIHVSASFDIQKEQSLFQESGYKTYSNEVKIKWQQEIS